MHWHRLKVFVFILIQFDRACLSAVVAAVAAAANVRVRERLSVFDLFLWWGCSSLSSSSGFLKTLLRNVIWLWTKSNMCNNHHHHWTMYKCCTRFTFVYIPFFLCFTQMWIIWVFFPSFVRHSFLGKPFLVLKMFKVFFAKSCRSLSLSSTYTHNLRWTCGQNFFFRIHLRREFVSRCWVPTH